MTECLIETKNLFKTYDNGRIEALRGVDLRVEPREFVAITGPSGSGKSTLLQLLGGLDHPTRGYVQFKGRRLSHDFDFDFYRSHQVGFIFQSFHLIPSLTALQNVQIPMFESKLRSKERRRKAETLLTQMGLEHRLNKYPNELSAGERQRVAIARSLANGPEILLADEPTGNLDTENAAKTMQLLTGIQATENVTLIVVTHQPEIAESAHRKIHIRDGLISFDK